MRITGITDFSAQHRTPRPEDLKQVHALQDAIEVEQSGGPGKFEMLVLLERQNFTWRQTADPHR